MAKVLETDIGRLLTSPVHLHSLGAGDVIVRGNRTATVGAAVLGRGVVAYTVKYRKSGWDTLLGDQNALVDRVVGGR